LKSPVETLVETAARRRLCVSGLENSAVALAIVLGGTILLLLLGTQILGWPWLLLLAAVGVGIVFGRVRRGLLSPYRIAQLVDRKLDSHDLVSTAWYLLRNPEAENHHVAKAQIQSAELFAPRVKPNTLFPLMWRRSWTLVCALAAVAFGLFALRYLVTRSIDFRSSLLPMTALSPAVALERLQHLIAPHHNRDAESSEVAKLKLAPTDLPREHEDSSHNTEKSGLSSQPGQSTADKPGAAWGDAKSATASPAQSPDSSSPASAGKEKDSTEQANHAPGSDQPSPSSLSDRMRDALSGMMEKMRSQSGTSSNKQQGGQQASKQSSGSDARKSQASESGQPSPSENQAANREQNGQAAGQAQATEKSAAQSQSAAQGGSKNGSDSQSGIGRQDGEKTLREADQLRAIGKLDEIIGKRSAALTGDMTVETRSSSQQLQTQYSGRVGRHSDSGGVIGHDEVPLALQNYVRTYMEQVHKQANESR
jgi:hypothetical protein